MNIAVKIPHPVRFAGPWFREDSGTQIHRFLDPEFVARFQRDLAAGTASQNLPQPADRFSDHDNAVVLRLPVHRNFYVVSTELVCDRIGMPALDPARIASAGFVVRRVGGREQEAWMIEDGEPVGWSVASGETRDPDLNRRMQRSGILCHHPSPPAYSGELTHPLHPTTVRSADGKLHTILFGYLPLGGFNYRSEFSVDAAEQRRSLEQLSADWPFSTGQGRHRHRWSDDNAEQVAKGVPTRAFAQFLRSLVFRYKLGEASLPENAALEAALDQLVFHELPQRSRGTDRFSDATREQFKTYRRYSLLAYIEACGAAAENPLVDYFTRHARLLESGSGSFPPLPDSAGRGTLDYSLLLSEADAQELRELLRRRTLTALHDKDAELPVPRYQQRRVDLYRIIPFARVRDDRGDERTYWADPQNYSEPFRVAAPFDPLAARPSLIQMPSLKDLRKGLAKGPSFAMPPDLAHLVQSLKKDKGLTPDLVEEPMPDMPAGGLQTICSLSIPIVTVAAMIVLMIVVSILDFFLRWMPYVFQCLPIPTSNDRGD